MDVINCNFAFILLLDTKKLIAMAGYYELPVPREHVGNYGGLNGNVYGPTPPMPYTNKATQGLYMPVSSALNSQI